jgi:hypothetical protein
MVGRCGLFYRGRDSLPALLAVLAFRQQGGFAIPFGACRGLRPKSLPFRATLPDLEEFQAFPGACPDHPSQRRRPRRSRMVLRSGGLSGALRSPLDMEFSGRPPALQVAFGTRHAGAGPDRPGLIGPGCGGGLRNPPGPGRPWPEADTIFQSSGFSWAKVASGPCRPHPPSYMRHTVAIARAFYRLGVWIGAPSGPDQPAAKRRI